MALQERLGTVTEKDVEMGELGDYNLTEMKMVKVVSSTEGKIK